MLKKYNFADYPYKKSALFFPINGSGLGHLTRCLAYARHLPKDWDISFFTLSPLIRPILDMGFRAEYFVSPFWSAVNSKSWNGELAFRLGLYLEEIQPQVLIFDGTWPFHGLKHAILSYKRPIKLVWSRRGLLKEDSNEAAEQIKFFNLVMSPGELCGDCADNENILPPVTIFDESELLDRETALKHLKLDINKKYILFTLGSGNLKNMDELSRLLLNHILEAGYTPVWLRSPLSVNEVSVPPGVLLIDTYPIASLLKAFDGVIGAAGYNTCYENACAGVPTLFIPNEKLVDNQLKRAECLAQTGAALILQDLSPPKISQIIRDFLDLAQKPIPYPKWGENGAVTGAKLIVKTNELS